ncbi:uncharacterized protein BCR38DRAFT_443729 [Pseudomassariella vexata]|uniref:Uncharacterized protein n=1 Tax=Pseudomassariella vexata TaxID=1141098 RepID=A0A1Y2DLB8_9PEZI|nr:uncharacterized protein BCR38DRAFT_443729 [Pseudomassariella vexata]ORY60032.1 hypothetical protein BCR38DRAFT_443729 [Pseudomassariella vexata]
MKPNKYSNITRGYGAGSMTRPEPAAQVKQDPKLSIWFSLATMTSLVLCLVAVIVVVRVVDGESITSWTVGPTVILTVLSNLITMLLSLMLTTSITIRWWREAQRGAGLSQLHQIWAVNRNPLFQPHKWR